MPTEQQKKTAQASTVKPVAKAQSRKAAPAAKAPAQTAKAATSAKRTAPAQDTFIEFTFP